MLHVEWYGVINAFRHRGNGEVLAAASPAPWLGRKDSPCLSNVEVIDKERREYVCGGRIGYNSDVPDPQRGSQKFEADLEVGTKYDCISRARTILRREETQDMDNYLRIDIEEEGEVGVSSS